MNVSPFHVFQFFTVFQFHVSNLQRVNESHNQYCTKMERERKRQKKNKSCLSFVLFGSTGDLSRKKLFPAFANLLHRTNLQYEKITIYCLGRRDIKVEALVEKQCVNVKTEYKEKLFASVKYV